MKNIISLSFIVLFTLSCMDYNASYNISLKSSSVASDPDPISDANLIL